MPPASGWSGCPEDESTPPLEPSSPEVFREDPLSSQGSQSQEGVEVDDVLEGEPEEEELEEDELEEDEVEEDKMLIKEELSETAEEGLAEDE